MDVTWFNEAVFFIKALFNNEIDSIDGIKIGVDAPAGNNHMLNIVRPGVMRHEYGLTSVDENASNNKIENGVSRFFYGASDCKFGYSQVGTHPNDQYTLPLNKKLHKIGDEILQFVSNCEEFRTIKNLRNRPNSKIEFLPFNHCSILIYFGLHGYKKYSTLSSHCDNTYRPNGEFVHRLNSQVENTPTITLTIGDSRIIHYHRRYSSNGKFWDKDLEPVHSHTLSHGSINVVHPDDERPFEIEMGNQRKKCQIQHGNIRVGLNKMSIAFVFRTVKTISVFDKSTHRRIIDKEIPITHVVKHQHLHESIDKRDFQHKFQELFKQMMHRHPELVQ